MWNRKELKQRGKDALKRNRWKAVLASMAYTAIACTSAGVASSSAGRQTDSAENGFAGLLENPAILISCFVLLLAVTAAVIFVYVLTVSPLEVGFNKFHINAVRDTASISDMGYGYDVSYKRNVKTLFFRDLYSVLWTLLFIIPGIVKMYEYRMIPYILAENPEIGKKDAFILSKKMMKGNKWRAFVLDISFILWDILGAITLGIVSILYVMPYRKLTSAALYEELKSQE